MTKKPVRINPITHERSKSYINQMIQFREEFLKDIENHHVKIQAGNMKTGNLVPTVSLIPIIDCANCGKCKDYCYDLRKDCMYENVRKDRAKNSAIHLADLPRFWNEIKQSVIDNKYHALRINVGGDLPLHDFVHLSAVAKEIPTCDFLFFTKNYLDANSYIDLYGNFPPNVHPIFSAWLDVPMYNPHNFPTSHVVWADGKTTAPEYGAYYCQGDCSECFYNFLASKGCDGCFGLKEGEAVCFLAH